MNKKEKVVALIKGENGDAVLSLVVSLLDDNELDLLLGGYPDKGVNKGLSRREISAVLCDVCEIVAKIKGCPSSYAQEIFVRYLATVPTEYTISTFVDGLIGLFGVYAYCSLLDDCSVCGDSYSCPECGERKFEIKGKVISTYKTMEIHQGNCPNCGELELVLFRKTEPSQIDKVLEKKGFSWESPGLWAMYGLLIEGEPGFIYLDKANGTEIESIFDDDVRMGFYQNLSHGKVLKYVEGSLWSMIEMLNEIEKIG